MSLLANRNHRGFRQRSGFLPTHDKTCSNSSDEALCNISCRSEGKDEKSEGEGKDGKGEMLSVSPADLYNIGKTLSISSLESMCLSGRNERTVVMDKSKGEPVISVKTKSKERVSNHRLTVIVSHSRAPRVV